MPILVLVVMNSGLRRDIVVKTIESQLDMQVLAPRPRRRRLLAAVRRAQPDVVVLGLGDGLDDGLDAGMLDTLLWCHPRIPVLVFERDAQRASLHRLIPRRTDLGALSPALLTEHLRAVSAR